LPPKRIILEPEQWIQVLCLFPLPRRHPPEVPPQKVHCSDFSLHPPPVGHLLVRGSRLAGSSALAILAPASSAEPRRNPVAPDPPDARHLPIDPGSEFHLLREWFSRSARADVLGSGSFASM
jgi:hypothetical protein